MVGEHRRVDPARKLAQLPQRAAAPRASVSSRSAGRLGVPPTRDLEQLQRHADAEEPLLRAVVEIALEAPPLLVARSHDARPRLAQLQQLRPQLGLQPLVLERQARCGPDRLQHRGLIQRARDRG